MSAKTTFSNGRTMTAGFYAGLRLTNRQAQIVEMMRNERTTIEIAASLGIQEGSVKVMFALAARSNGISNSELRERCNIGAVSVGRKPATVCKGRTLSTDQATLQLALRFNSDIHNAALWLGWTVKECLGHMMEACTKWNVLPTLENFLKIT
jgi:hypothetical protein